MSLWALANAMAISPALKKAMVEVILRPKLSSAYIMNRLAQGTAKAMPNVYCSDLVILKPWLFMMLGSHVPRPMATPKNALKQIMPARTRTGKLRQTTTNGSDLVLLAASVLSCSLGPGRPILARMANACSPLPWVASQRGD